jgi:phenylpropionate dioxygenase-like ring-hydroxylating dioxygenase large terminal subunit
VTAFANHPALRRYWHPVAATTDLLGGPLPRRLLGVDVVVWRGPGGQVSAAVDRCPHRESPLSAGHVRDDGCLVCPYHGWTYDGDGRCVLVPSAGPGAPIPPRAVLGRVHAVERYGLVWLCLEEPVAGVPEMARYDEDPAFRRINNPVEEWHTATTRMVDNFLDTSHFPFVHRASFGGATDPRVAKVELGPLDDFFGYAYQVDAANVAVGAEGASGQATTTVTRRMTTGFTLPFAVRSTIEYETGLQHILLLLSAPIDDERSWFTFVVWRNDDFSVPADEVVRLDRQIGAEDKAMLERVLGTLALDATSLVNVQADKAGVEWKRRLRELLG